MLYSISYLQPLTLVFITAVVAYIPFHYGTQYVARMLRLATSILDAR